MLARYYTKSDLELNPSLSSTTVLVRMQMITTNNGLSTPHTRKHSNECVAVAVVPRHCCCCSLPNDQIKKFHGNRFHSFQKSTKNREFFSSRYSSIWWETCYDSKQLAGSWHWTILQTMVGTWMNQKTNICITGLLSNGCAHTLMTYRRYIALTSHSKWCIRSTVTTRNHFIIIQPEQTLLLWLKCRIGTWKTYLFMFSPNSVQRKIALTTICV